MTESTFRWFVCVLAAASGVAGAQTRDLSLADAVRMAIERYPDVEIQRNAVRSAEQGVRAARGAFDPLLRSESVLRAAVTPSGSALEAPGGRLQERQLVQSATVSQRIGLFGARLEAGLSNTRFRTSNPFFSLNPFDSPRLTMNLSLPLLRNRALDADRAELRVRRRQQAMSGLELEAKLVEIAGRVESAYWDLASAREQTQAAAKLSGLAGKALDATRRLAEAGQLPLADIAGARARFAQSTEIHAAATGQERAAESSLKELIAANASDALWGETLRLTTERPNFPEDPASELTVRALSRRVELRLLAEQKLTAEIQRKLAAEAFKPRIDLNVTGISQGLAGNEVKFGSGGFFGFDLSVPRQLIGGAGRGFSQLRSFTYPTWQAGLSIELPIGNRTAGGELARARIAEQRVGLEREKWERTIVREVQQSLALRETGERRVAAAGEAVTQASARLDSELRLLDGGKSNNLNVNTRQAELADAEQRLVVARRAFHQTAGDLRRASGSLLEAYAIQIQ